MRLRYVAKALWAACAIGASGFVALFVWIAVRRAAYPFDLEWLEGGVVDHVERLLEGKPLYVAPTVDFVPYIYNPLYYALGAGVASIVGVDYLALRLVSITATLACFGLIFALVWRETRAFVPALFAVGVYAGSFALSGAWFDLARVDSTCLAFCLGAWFTARVATTPLRLMGSAALVLLAFATKQSAVALAPIWLLSIVWTRGPRSSAWFLVPLVPLAVCIVWLERSTDGWYSYYAYRVAMGHPDIPEMYVDFWKQEIFQVFPIPLLFGFYFLAAAYGAWDKSVFRIHMPFAVGLTGMAYLLRLHSGSFLNDDMPAYAALAVVGGLGLAALTRDTEPVRRLHGETFGYAIALCQLLYLTYSPTRYLPTPSDLSEGRSLVAAMQRVRGDVLVTQHGHYSRLARKPSFAHGMAVFDIVRTESDYRGAKAKLQQSFETALSSHRFGAVLTDDGLVFGHLVERYYRRGPASFMKNQNGLLPKTGPPYRPRNFYIPK